MNTRFVRTARRYTLSYFPFFPAFYGVGGFLHVSYCDGEFVHALFSSLRRGDELVGCGGSGAIVYTWRPRKRTGGKEGDLVSHTIK